MVQAYDGSNGINQTIIKDIYAAFDLFLIDNHPTFKCRDLVTSFSVHSDPNCTTGFASDDIDWNLNNVTATRFTPEGYIHELYL